jgi:hypothetical protein
MKKFKQYLDEKGRCWTGYKPVPGKKAFSKDSCVKEEEIEEKVKQPTGDLKSACRKGYTAVGTKEKNGRSVPNCVPVKEDGSAGPTNVVGGGAIAGTGGKGGEPGVYLKKKKDNTPIMMNVRRKAPQ